MTGNRLTDASRVTPRIPAATSQPTGSASDGRMLPALLGGGPSMPLRRRPSRIFSIDCPTVLMQQYGPECEHPQTLKQQPLTTDRS